MLRIMPKSVKRRMVVGADFHFEFQDAKAVSGFLDVVKDGKPDTVVIAGDLLDEYTLSKFMRVPSRRGLLDEVKSAKSFLYQLRDTAPEADIVFIFGNHDQRLGKRIVEKLPEIHGLVSLSSLLDCEELGILALDDIESVNVYEWHDVLVGHFDKALKRAGASSYSLMEQYQKNVIQPHAHRGAVSWKRTWDGELWAADCPCLCRLDPKFVKRPDWCHGAIIVDWDGKKTIPELVKF